ncbi:MAG: RNA polymerase sigma factor YlaC [Firmicutes bacterium ADurb.BinA205]|nr:MAG: RNA polymerase sigma factor YlaC [Firmicutes bacterium ADurb.BinA205]HOC34644.1 RNA polymerase sigma factor [Ruminococcus flavefaciens]HQM02820.1 RNA polymerase sigma factor [Ruminococcus flavefaciens]
MSDGSSSYSRFLSGDRDAIDEVIRDYKDGLIYYINSIIGDMDLSEEAAIDVFIKLYVDKPAFKGGSAFKTWLYTIGRNKAYDILRKRARSAVLSLDDDFPVPSDENIEQNYIQQEEGSMLRRTVSRLKPEYSQILCLVYFENFDNSEAARIMKKSSKQIRDLLYRAKNALKRELEKEGADYDGL